MVNLKIAASAIALGLATALTACSTPEAEVQPEGGVVVPETEEGTPEGEMNMPSTSPADDPAMPPDASPEVSPDASPDVSPNTLPEEEPVPDAVETPGTSTGE